MSTSTYFNGVSSYAADLNQVITRSMNIAAMPLTIAQNQLQSLDNQQSALSSLDKTFAALQTAVQNLQTAMGTGSYAATSSNSDQVSASAGTGALTGTYTVQVSSIGSYATVLSADTLSPVTDPYTTSLSSATDYTLNVNGTDYDIKPAGTGLLDLAQAINASSAGVRASLVNTGSSSSPNYRLVVTSTKLGSGTTADTITLNDGTQNLFGTVTPGSPATYTVNGITTTIQSDSRTVTLAPGVTVDLLQPTGNQAVTVSVGRDSTQLSTALSGFVTAYNAAVDALSAQTGKSGGALTGESIVRQLTQALRNLTQFTPSGGSITGLAEMGLELGGDGHYAFDSTAFSSVGMDALQTFLGDGTSTGFLKNASDVMKSVEDDSTGALKQAIQQNDDTISNQNDRIDTIQQRLSDMQADLTNRMAAADATIAALESKRDYFNNLFTAMQNQNKNS